MANPKGKVPVKVQVQRANGYQEPKGKKVAFKGKHFTDMLDQIAGHNDDGE